MPATSPYAPAAAPTAPSLGYGQRAEAPINAVNQWMRTQPWYQSLIRSFGQDPSNVHLSDSQKQAVIRAAQANGVVVDEGHNGQEVDDSGNFQAKSHALRNTLIVAGIAAAALATAGAAGAFGGAAAGGGAAAAPASVGAIEGGAYGLPAAAAAAVPGAVAAPTVAGAATAGANAAFDAAGNFVGPSTVSSVGGGYGPAATAGGGLSVTDALRYGLPTAGGIVSGLIQANASGKASDAQQAYLQQALDYEKQKDAGNISREASRYSDFEGRISPYLATGNSANSRMASLLGLPANAPLTAPSAAAPSTPASSSPSPAAPTAAPAAPSQEPMIAIVGPDGSTRTLPKSQADYYISRGAKPAQAAA